MTENYFPATKYNKCEIHFSKDCQDQMVDGIFVQLSYG